MKKIFFILLLSILFLTTFFVRPVQAAGFGTDLENQLSATAGGDGAGYGAPTDPRYIVASIISMATGFIGILFTALAFYAGIMWGTSGGSEEKIGKAKKILLYSSIGVLLWLSAFSITYFISKSFITATTTYPISGETIQVETGMVGSEFYTEPGLKSIID